ncbi:hypothetical protein [Pseudomonas glycinae]|nr:hypothetical protein [Pseudomonas glycinae]
MSLGQALQALVAFNVARGEVASVFIVLFRQRLQQLIQRPCPPDVPVIIKAIGDQSMLFEQVAGDGQNFSRYHSISTLQMTDVFCRADGRRLMEQE